MDRLDRMLHLVRRHVPDLRLVDKAEVWWMRAFGRALSPVVPDFQTRFTTVLGRTVYLPCPVERFPRDALAATLAHELVHQLDQRRWGLLFYVSYGFALPLGRTLRAHWERRGYTVDLLLALERGGEPEVRRIAEILAGVFSGSSYLWMWMGHAAARRFLAPAVDAVLSGRAAEEEPYRSILAAWRGDPIGEAPLEER